MISYPHLFSPLTIGPVTAPNRVMSAAHGERLAEDGLLTERQIAYYERKAQGGTGIVFLEPVRVAPDSVTSSRGLVGWRPGQAPRFRRLAERVQAHGALLFGQIIHLGAQGGSMFSGLPLASPSGVPSPAVREVPHALTATEIAQLIEAYVQTGQLMRDAGFAGVEVHAAHGYLLAQFLSPLTNRRTDAYGGDRAGRVRLVSEILAALRAELGRGVALGVRLNVDDLAPGGCDHAEMVEVAALLAGQASIDFLSLSVGTYAGEGLSAIIADHGYAPGYLVDKARAFKQRLPHLVTAAVGRIATPDLAEQVIAGGGADLVGATRAIIADPQWAAKARAGQVERIRPCIACNACLATNRANIPLECTVNADCVPSLTPPPMVRGRVVVVGGGLAGLEAARTAAANGCAVTLYERRSFLGGQAALAARTGTRPEVAALIAWLTAELVRLGVAVRLNHAATEPDLAAADRVVIATGARPADANTRNYIDLMEHGAPPARQAVVIDREHGYGALSVAHFLRARGAAVLLVTDQPMIGGDLPPGAMGGALARLLRAGIEVLPLHAATPDQDGVCLRHGLTGAETRRPADLVVVAGERVADDALWRNRPGRVAAGDALAPRTMLAAIREGWRAVQA